MELISCNWYYMKFYFFLLDVVQIVAKIINKNGFCSENVNFYLFIYLVSAKFFKLHTSYWYVMY